MTGLWIELSGCLVIAVSIAGTPSLAIGALYQTALLIYLFCVVLTHYQDVKETTPTGMPDSKQKFDK